MQTEHVLDIIEAAHRREVGTTGFCYVAVPYNGHGTLYRMAVCRAAVNGYYPISEDHFLGSEQEMRKQADELNDKRLGLTERKAAIIVAASMTCAGE